MPVNSQKKNTAIASLTPQTRPPLLFPYVCKHARLRTCVASAKSPVWKSSDKNGSARSCYSLGCYSKTISTSARLNTCSATTHNIRPASPKHTHTYKRHATQCSRNSYTGQAVLVNKGLPAQQCKPEQQNTPASNQADLNDTPSSLCSNPYSGAKLPSPDLPSTSPRHVP